MALRVLLADESSTIKKVIQLSLHDFGVDIKAVGNGLDALSVAESYAPDLVFVDVLLSKKSGYEVIREIKTHPDLKKTPVVLMWSGFMQLDEAKAKASHADARLEKPFDSEQLRELVQNLVPKTKSNPVSQFLVFPPMPDFQENPSSSPSTPAPQGEPVQKNFNPGTPERDMILSAESEGGWSQQTLSKKPQVKVTSSTHEEFEEFSFDELSAPQLPPAKVQIEQPSPSLKPAAPPPLSEARVEEILREEVRIILQRLCTKLVPEIAERAVKEEIQKILSTPPPGV